MDDVGKNVMGLLLQGVVFLIGLCLSLVVGMMIGARTEGPGGLLIATLVAGVGLLGAAVLSQIAHDRVVYGGPEATR